jgi:hypothetical protein
MADFFFQFFFRFLVLLALISKEEEEEEEEEEGCSHAGHDVSCRKSRRCMHVVLSPEEQCMHHAV